jgi:hypothetical protein
MAAPALLGTAASGMVDALVGPALGRIGGRVWSWVTGKPPAEDQPTAPPPSATPGSPVRAPNGNPGTVPSPPAAGVAPGGRPKTGRRVKRPAVQLAPGGTLAPRRPGGLRTAPAAGFTPARLAGIALKG